MLLTKPAIMAQALDILAEEIQCGDGVASAAIAEAAEHVRHLGAIKAWWDGHADFDALNDLMGKIP
jgi:hypothetical protein